MVKYIILCLFSLLLLAGCSVRNNNNENNSNFNAEQLSVMVNSSSDNNTPTNALTSNNISSTAEDLQKEPAIPVETVIAEFSTIIYDKTSSRLNNLRIACSKLNGTTINPSETFSFCKTVGPSSEKDGYLKADGLDSNGETIKVLGGGKCQISSTLYNAVLSVPNLSVVERHAHSKQVPYVDKDKDATVAYDYLDLKFVNNLDSQIKIYCNSDDKSVYIKLVKLS